MLEKEVEKALLQACRSCDILCLKFTSPGTNGVADRMLLGYNTNKQGVMVFVEVKRPGQHMRANQRAQAHTMLCHGGWVTEELSCVDDIEPLLLRHFGSPSTTSLSQLCGYLPHDNDLTLQAPILTAIDPHDGLP